VQVEIRDTGPGIRPEVLSRVFEPFYTTKEVGKGTGLGLAITYGIIQEHGGHIVVSNHPEGGAVFTVQLPLEPG
jgi:two-component system sensor histidine kinase HupT/HoxJ